VEVEINSNSERKQVSAQPKFEPGTRIIRIDSAGNIWDCRVCDVSNWGTAIDTARLSVARVSERMVEWIKRVLRDGIGGTLETEGEALIAEAEKQA